ncbi:MAG: hypothetical protein D6695_02810 [Planctomycetota bacterium]|nr:MAG: hypothetical protein D6695_02810 [Planctomycetota bacterium]
MRAAYLSIAAAVCAAPALAAPIEFTHFGSGSGTIDGVSFSTTFTITAVGNTDDRVDIGFGYFIDHLSASITIGSIGTYDFITATRTFVNNSNQIVGFSRAGISGADLFNGPIDPFFASWDMTTSTDFITGSGNLLQWGLSDVVTSGGVLYFDDFTTDAAFVATIVPAPASIGLLALTGLAATRRRR